MCESGPGTQGRGSRYRELRGTQKGLGRCSIIEFNEPIPLHAMVNKDKKMVKRVAELEDQRRVTNGLIDMILDGGREANVQRIESDFKAVLCRLAA